MPDLYKRLIQATIYDLNNDPDIKRIVNSKVVAADYWPFFGSTEGPLTPKLLDTIDTITYEYGTSGERFGLVNLVTVFNTPKAGQPNFLRSAEGDASYPTGGDIDDWLLAPNVFRVMRNVLRVNRPSDKPQFSPSDNIQLLPSYGSIANLNNRIDGLVGSLVEQTFRVEENY